MTAMGTPPNNFHKHQAIALPSSEKKIQKNTLNTLINEDQCEEAAASWTTLV